MKKSNESNMIPQSSNQVSGPARGLAPAPTLMYLIELDPSISTCLAGGSLPLQMLNVNQDNTHYLIPIQGPDPLETPQYKHLQQYEETLAQPSVSSEDVRIEINTIGATEKLPINQTKARKSDGCADTNKKTTIYGSHAGDLKTSISASEEYFDQSHTTTERLLMGASIAQPLTDSGERPACKYVHVADSVPPSRAVLSLPAALRLHRGRVTPRKLLPPARFGPVRGVTRDVSSEEARELVLKAAASYKPVFLLPKGDGFCHIDVSDQEKSNWFSLLPLGRGRSANVWLEQRGGELFASSRRLPPRAALRLGYAASLATALRLPPAMPVQPPNELDWCGECGRELQGAAPHACPKALSTPPRRRYRCKYCALPFARLFTLKRHMSLHCKSKATNTSSAVPAPALPPEPASPPAGDERAASADSFHTYSGLELSAALFGHDLSHLCRDDSLLAQPADNATSTTDVQFPPLDYSKKVARTASLIKCPHCQLTMSSNMKQRHKRQCLARGVACACGKSFRDRERLERHLRQDHAPPPAQRKGDTESAEANGSSYKCEQCQNTFKRRGMLVNHSWRVHGAAPRVPLSRRQRHYPCAACPKLYRSAAKRDHHVRAHHPGWSGVRAACIESGAVLGSPALCAACPRQYASRAKMLQHMRSKHPRLAPPSKSKPKQAQIEPSLT